MKEQKQRKNEGGITLIALVVTIVILLILAGVTLGTVLSDGGLIDQTKEAIEEHEQAQEKEKEELGEAAGMMRNLIDGLGSTGGTTPVTPPTTTGGTGSSEVAGELREYQGKYVDIGLDIDDKEDTTNDWELFYATDDRIFLISADYVPVSKLKEWKVIETNGTLDGVGFKEYASYPPYSVCWPSYPAQFLDLPTEPSNFLGLVMHNGYNLNEHKGSSEYGSKATSHLLNTNSWKGIKEAATEQENIEFVIGGPTLEMWCEAWNKAVVGDANGFVGITPSPQPGSYGYYVSSDSKQNRGDLYMNGTTSSLASDKLMALETNYKTFFPHTGTSSWNKCSGYWLASPSAYDYESLMYVDCGGRVNNSRVSGRLVNFANDLGVRPVVSLKSGVQIVETVEGSGKYKIAE